MSHDTTPAFPLSKERKFTMPLAFILALIASTAAGVTIWTRTQGQVDRHDEQIKEIKIEQRDQAAEQKAMREMFIEIRGDIKYLVRDKRREEAPK